MERMKDLTQQYVEQLNSIIKDLREEKFKLVEENERLKSDLEECECSFGFESDEVGFWKREYKSLQNVIKKLNEDVDYRHHRAMVAERGGKDED